MEVGPKIEKSVYTWVISLSGDDCHRMVDMDGRLVYEEYLKWLSDKSDAAKENKSFLDDISDETYGEE